MRLLIFVSLCLAWSMSQAQNIRSVEWDESFYYSAAGFDIGAGINIIF